MKGTAGTALVVALVVATLTLGSVASATATRGQPDQALPYRATYVMSATGMEMAPGYPDEKSDFAGRCSVPSDWVIAFVGSGQATRLGSLAFSSSHCTQVGAAITISDGHAELVPTAA